jgi:hypothetical protein
VPGKELAQVFACLTHCEILPEQTLDRIRNLGRGTAISNGPRRRLMQTERSTHAEVIRVNQTSLDFYFFAVNANVGNPVLSAAIGASRNVQLEVLIEARQTLFEFSYQPAGKTFRLRDC